jgi:hypothetical protein
VAESDSFDEAFCQRVDEQIHDYALPVSDGCKSES